MGKEGSKAFYRPGSAPLEVVARLPRAESNLVRKPDKKVRDGFEEERRSPTELRIARVIGPAVDQE